MGLGIRRAFVTHAGDGRQPKNVNKHMIIVSLWGTMDGCAVGVCSKTRNDITDVSMHVSLEKKYIYSTH